MSAKRPNDDPHSSLPLKLQKSDSGRPVDPAAQIAAAKARIAARMAALSGPRMAPSPPPPAAANPAATSAIPDIAARLAAAQAKIQSLKANAILPSAPQSARPTPPPVVGAGRTSGAAPLGIHPALLESSTPALSLATSAKDKGRTMQPKFTSLKANARSLTSAPSGAATPTTGDDPVVQVNPYLAAAAASVTDEEGGIVAKTRSSRKFHFNQKGKYVAQAEQIRADANMEALKQRIAESARKAGLDNEFDTLEKAIRRQPPPVVEWWDEPMLPSGTYEDVANGSTSVADPEGPIKIYVQHPVQIAAPWDKKKVEARPLMLTKKEAKKMRRQRRLADLKDKQDRIRMGLIPPDAPKVSVANLMRVLANDAISDPTKIEAKVKREVSARRLKHEKTNEKNKLTHEQRKEKEAKQRAKDEDKGLYAAVFKIRYLVNPAHKLKIRENAKQSALSGCCIFHPKFALVLVEGSAKNIKFYKRVLLVRIDWTEEPRIKETEDGEEGDAQGGLPLGEDGEPIDLDTNRCDLVWEGPIKERSYDLFRSKFVESDKVAREFLGEDNQGYWDVAAKFVPSDDA